MTTTRRSFLKATAAAAAGFTIVPPYVLGGPRHVAPSDKVNIALIGAGGQGRTNLRALLKLDDAQVIAVADPAEHWDLSPFYYKGEAGRRPVRAEIEKARRNRSGPARVAEYADFRTMLEKEPAIDAVLCATPDHLHAYVSVLAMRGGKHVYCEKPLAHNVAEARLMARVAHETGVATQLGNQGHSTEGMRRTVEWIQSGAIGPVRHVHAWVGTSRWNPRLQGKPEGSMPVPGGLDWDLWLGPREARAFHQAYAPVAWRDFWAFGSSALGDFGCHDLDAATWALDLHAPERVEATPAGYHDADIAPYGALATFRFPARGDRPPLTVSWYDGGLKPPAPEGLKPGPSLPNRGVLFVGEKATLLCGGAGGPPRILTDRPDDFPQPEPALPRSKGHHRDWLDAIKGGSPAGSHFAYGARLTEVVLLGVAALRTGTAIDWDANAMKARGASAGLDAVLDEPRRKGWELDA